MDTFLYLLNGWRNTVANVGIIMQTHCVFFFSLKHTHTHTHTHIPSFLCEVELNGLLRRLIISPFIQPGWNESLLLTHDLVCAVRWRYVWRATWIILYLSGHVLKVLDFKFCQFNILYWPASVEIWCTSQSSHHIFFIFPLWNIFRMAYYTLFFKESSMHYL